MSIGGSLEVNLQPKTYKSSMTSERFEVSDDIDSGAKIEADDETQEDQSDLELTGNSISEQDEEEDDSEYEVNLDNFKLLIYVNLFLASNIVQIDKY